MQSCREPTSLSLVTSTMDVPNDGEIEEGEAVPVLIQDGMIKEDGEAEEKEEEDGEEIAEIPQEDVPRVPPPPIDATPLDLGEDAWDDKSLIRAWDESMRLYKVHRALCSILFALSPPHPCSAQLTSTHIIEVQVI